MDDLVESILDYIRADYTDYAIMINGEWGSGKTYFWNHKIRNKIEAMQINGKKYTTIYMSLYGISNLEEISKKIFIETTQLMDKNLKKYMGSKGEKVIPEYAKTGLDMANFFGVLKASTVPQLMAEARKVVSGRGLDITPFKELLEKYVDEEKIRSSPCDLYVTSLSVTDWREVVFDVKQAPPGTIKDVLLASAFFPAFKNEKLGGKTYLDGGMVNNVPVDVLAERGHKNLIVIRIYGIGVDTERRAELPEDVNVYRIAPRRNLGGILEFEKKRTRRSMTLGYFDAKRLLYGLAGRKYYFYLPHTEAYYFNRLMTEIQIFRHYLSAHLEQAGGEGSPGCRMYTEHVFPALAEKFKLKPDWDYRELYGAVLEVCARSMDLEVFDIYTADGIMERVHRILGKS